MKKFLFVLVSFLFIISPAFAEKIPVKIVPIQVVSTHHDETQVGDWINFETVNDIYVNDKLYIPKGKKVIGIVDYVHENGWLADSADITFKEFITSDINNNKINIPYNLKIKGNVYLEGEKREFITYTVYAFEWLAFFLRGPEIFIEPDTLTFNIFIER